MEIDVGLLVANRYELRRLLGAGAMGQVWAARHVSLEQIVAIKLMIAPREDDFEDAATTQRRFQIEAQVAAELSRKSKHIVRVTDHGVEDGTAYIVMELLEGKSLDRAIDETGRLEPGVVTAIVSQISKGLEVAHAEGVIHRDLKPANVFLTRDEEGTLVVKILDFGIARLVKPAAAPERESKAPTRLTERGMVLGSADYMSPEQTLAHPVDVRTDVWSLAVVAFEGLTGSRPFADPSVEGTMRRICNHDATPLREVLTSASSALAEVFVKAFAPNIDDRFQTTSKFIRALSLAAPPSELPTNLEFAPASATRKPTRIRWPFIAGGVAAAVLVGGVVWAVGRPRASTVTATSEVTDSAPATSSRTTDAPVASASIDVPRPTASPPQSVNKRPTPNPTNPMTTSTPSAAKSVDRSAVF